MIGHYHNTIVTKPGLSVGMRSRKDLISELDTSGASSPKLSISKPLNKDLMSNFVKEDRLKRGLHTISNKDFEPSKLYADVDPITHKTSNQSRNPTIASFKSIKAQTFQSYKLGGLGPSIRSDNYLKALERK